MVKGNHRGGMNVKGMKETLEQFNPGDVNTTFPYFMLIVVRMVLLKTEEEVAIESILSFSSSESVLWGKGKVKYPGKG